jgi:hypothetical protein
LIELSIKEDELIDIASPIMDQATAAESRSDDVSAVEAAPVETGSETPLRAPQSAEQAEVVPTDAMLDAVPTDNGLVEVVDSSVSVEPMQVFQPMEEEESEEEDGNSTSRALKFGSLAPSREPAPPREFGFAFGGSVEMVQRPAEQQTFIPYPASLSVPESPSSIAPPPQITPSVLDPQPLFTNEEGSSPTHPRREEAVVTDSRLDSDRVVANPQPLFVCDPYPASLSNPLSHEQDPWIHQTNWTSSNAPNSELASVEKTADAAVPASASHSPPLPSDVNSATNGMASEPAASSVFSFHHLPASSSIVGIPKRSSVEPDPFQSTTNAVTGKRLHALETPAQSSLKDGVVERFVFLL